MHNRSRARPRSGWGTFIAALVLATSVGSCNRTGTKPGELVVSIETDMAMPDQVDIVRVRVTVPGQPLPSLDAEYDVGKPARDGTPIPATLTIVAGSNPTTPVTISVAGRKGGKWRTYREATTTVPVGRSATLRMPIQWLCDGSVNAAPATDGTDKDVLSSKCDSGNSCQAGKCVPTEVPSSTLNDYQPQAIFGGASEPAKGQCFDTLPCMIVGNVVEPDDDCTISPPNMHDLNVALRVASDGICDSTLTNCFVPLSGNSDEGWQLAARTNRVQLPQAACEKRRAGVVSGIYVSNSCQTKTEADPPCGKWSSVTQKATPPASIPDASVALGGSLVASLEGDAGAVSACCTLVSSGTTLYTCTCGANKAVATVVAIDSSTGSVHAVAHLSTSTARSRVAFSAALFDGVLYWPNGNNVERTSLVPGDAPATPLTVDTSTYYNGSIIVDGGTVYTLVSGDRTTMGFAVGLLKIAPDGTTKVFDTGGNVAILQLAADKDAVYLASAFDQKPDGGRITTRTSGVIRIAKADGVLSHVLPPVQLTVSNGGGSTAPPGGYTGVQADDTSLFTLYEDVAADAGTDTLEIGKIALGATSGTPQPFYRVSIDPTVSSLSMLGAVDGAVVLSRIETDATGAPQGSYVSVVRTAGAAPSIVGDFAHDYPLPGLATDAERIYWLTSSGKVFALPRSALR